LSSLLTLRHTVPSARPSAVRQSMVLSGCVGLTVMWVANFKLLAYTGNRGALAHPDVQASSLVWAALLVLPFFPAKSEIYNVCLTNGRLHSCFRQSMCMDDCSCEGATATPAVLHLPCRESRIALCRL
jgi:hypothetical protein